MVSPSYYQPLINPPSTAKKTIHKFLLFSLSIATFFSLVYLCLLIIQPQINPSIPSYHLKSNQPSNGHDHLLGKIMSVHVSHINTTLEALIKETNYNTNMKKNGVQRGALLDCIELMDLSRDRVALSMKSTKTEDINSWLSAVLTNHVTCLDQLPHNLSPLIRSLIEGLILHGKSLLAAHSSMENFLESSGSLPSWVRRSDRKLLEVSGSEVKADAVVAKDGSGDYTTVAEAVAGAPDKGKKRYVIYVKEGVYEENVEVGKKKKNLMIVGDGMNKTVITASLNVVDGSTTFRSATLAAVGDGFILQDICIQNTAGPEKHQAVALRVGADQSVINRCKIDAYQDTLYTHSLRQFYRDCSISGTVDFIFGNAAVVFQKCDLIARKPMSNQKNMVTAQGRIDPNQNTGTSIQNCNIKASSDLAPVRGQFPTFLGRPWKEYSRTVVMQSTIGDHIDPKGWFEWDGDFALDTLYYAEYKNQGSGSDTSKRVNWTGYHVITNSKEAKQFTVGEFIQGQEWLDSDIVTYVEGL